MYHPTRGGVRRGRDPAVCRNPGEPLMIEEIEVEPPKAWEIRIKILCTSICHTDVTFWKMSIGPFAVFPMNFGHEVVGVVESVGKHVEEVEEGDIVVPVFHPNCKQSIAWWCKWLSSCRARISSRYSVIKSCKAELDLVETSDGGIQESVLDDRRERAGHVGH